VDVVKYQLFDYQRDAALGCLKTLRRGRRDWQEDRSRSSFALSAITGAGKTVIATAVIEAMLHGSSDLSADADPRAAFLWVTDDPALNRQTRNKMLAASDLLQPARLVVLDNDFLDTSLSGGRVYFLNIQKLSKNAGLAQGGKNLRQYSFWEVVANTIASGTTDLYLVLDEAHRGVKPVTDRKTIVQRLIAGATGSNPPVPMVWGISATIARFTAAMDGVSDRTSYPHVEVDIDRVRASGLIKDEIGLDEPDEKGAFGTTLLREAVKATLDYDQRWQRYSTEQNEPEVRPVLVVQVADKASDAQLTDMVEVIESEWTGLAPDAIAHVFGEHERLHLGTRSVDWVPPESIQTDPAVRVVLAKTAISTGWDCPRAEVLYSERPAADATHIAQIIGRMVRAPLAHRVATDDTLNSVTCYLPKFNRDALNSIKSELEGTGKTGSDGPLGPSVLRAPKVFDRNPTLPAGVFEAIEQLPSVPAPDVLANPLRRAKEMARLLTDNANGSALLADAGKQLTKALNDRLNGLAAEHAELVKANVDNIENADLARGRYSFDGTGFSFQTYRVATHATDIDRECRRIIRSVREGVGMDYWQHRVNGAPAGTDAIDVAVHVAALLMVPGVVAEIERHATTWVRDRLAQFNVDIKNSTGATRDAFRRVQEQTVEPEAVTVDLRDNLTAATRKANGDPLPTYVGHLYADSDGTFPADLNSWERTVIETEIGRPTFVGWYRNPARPSPASLRIAYQSDDETWGTLQVDFLVVSRRDDGSFGASIVDPHGDFLADTRPKLRALARYAEDYGHRYVRIESVVKVGDTLRVLDLHDPAVRAEVLNFSGAQVRELYYGQSAHDFA
jgi:type III restriction enzyme